MQQKVSIHVLGIVLCKNFANHKLVEIFAPEIAKSKNFSRSEVLATLSTLLFLNISFHGLLRVMLSTTSPQLLLAPVSFRVKCPTSYFRCLFKFERQNIIFLLSKSFADSIDLKQ